MARGKQTCRILKEIRRRVAEANDIEYVTSECRYKGDCAGTCPRCEAEVRYLEEQLAFRRLAGKAVVLAGLTALSACSGGTNSVAETTSVAMMTDTITEEIAVESCAIEDSIEHSVSTPIVVDYKELLKVGEEEEDLVSENDEIAVTKDDFEDTADLNKIVMGEVIESPEPDPDGIYNIAMVPVKPDVDYIYHYVKDNLRYPQAAIDDGVEGRVVVQMIIDSLGLVKSPMIVRPRHPALDAEALELVSRLPKIRPAQVDGHNVGCYVTIPITFRLPSDSTSVRNL